MQKIIVATTRLWNAGCLGKIAIGFIGLFVVSCCMVALAGRSAPRQPTAIVVAPTAAPVPTTEPTIAPTAVPPSPIPEPTIAPTAVPLPPTLASTDIPASPIPEPTSPPIVIKGVAPVGEACPPDAPIKGNIVDRGARKGDKIYHVPGSAAYDKTKPERCFATAAEAEDAGFRAPAR